MAGTTISKDSSPLERWEGPPRHGPMFGGVPWPSIGAAHIGVDPAWTDGIDGELWQGRGQLRGDAVQRRFRNAIAGSPTVGTIGQLAATAGNIHDAAR